MKNTLLTLALGAAIVLAGCSKQEEVQQAPQELPPPPVEAPAPEPVVDSAAIRDSIAKAEAAAAEAAAAAKKPAKKPAVTTQSKPTDGAAVQKRESRDVPTQEAPAAVQKRAPRE
jgi:hypothetical protein